MVEPAELDEAYSEFPEEEADLLVDNLNEGNIVSKLDNLESKTNAEVYQDIYDFLDEAEQSMDKWKEKYNKAIKLAKMQPTLNGHDIEHKDFPFQGASLAMLPYITEAMLDFEGRAAPELVWAKELVHAKINGDESEAKQARQDRVKEYMNYQITEDIPQWRRQQDKALLALPCVGTIYKKTYYDFETGKICSDLRMPDKVIFDMHCDTFEDARHKFEEITYSRNEVISFIRGDQAWDIAEADLPEDEDDIKFVEAHTWIDLDEDGLKEPYCAILYPDKQKIVCLYPDYDEDTIHRKGNKVVKVEEKDTYTQYVFLPDPEGGPMGMGWGILLGPTFTAINTLVRQNIDAGTLHLSSANSGIISTSVGAGRGNRQQSGPIEVKMGQLTPVPTGGLNGSLRENVVQLPFQGPSTALQQLVEFLVESARSLATSAHNVEAVQGEAASLYLARLQQGLKVPNMIVMRVYEAAKEEFRKIAMLNYKHHDSAYYNKVLDRPERALMRQDFNPDDCDIDLVADPTQGSDIERVARAQNTHDTALAQLQYGQTPIDLRQATINLLKAQGENGLEELVPEPSQEPPPQVKAQIAQQQMEAEMQQREMRIKEQELKLKEIKQAQEAAKEMTELGLKADKEEAEISKTYAEALRELVDMGMSYSQARKEVLRNEETFIESEVPNGSVSQGKQSPSGNMAQRSGNQGVS